MSEFSKNKWKYSTIGLMAVLVVGFSFPQALAAASASLNTIFQKLTTVEGKVDAIKAKTDNIPSDPARQSKVGVTKAIQGGDLTIDPGDGQAQSFTVFGLDSSTQSRSGHITLMTDGAPGNTVKLYCYIDPGIVPMAVTLASFDPSSPSGGNIDFACDWLVIQVQDDNDGSDAGNVGMFYSAQFVETDNVVEQP